jgi:hypothetical protein
MRALAAAGVEQHCSLFPLPPLLQPTSPFAVRAAAAARTAHLKSAAAALSASATPPRSLPSIQGTSRPHLPHREGARGFSAQYGTDSAPAVPDPSLVHRYEKWRSSTISSVSSNGTSQAESYINISTGPGAVTLLACLHVIVDSGMLEDIKSGISCRSSSSHDAVKPSRGAMDKGLSVTCHGAHHVLLALQGEEGPAEYLRERVVWSPSIVAPALSSYKQRSHDTTLAFIKCGCDFAVLLAWLDVGDTNYLESTRKTERLVSFADTPAAASLERIDRDGCPSYLKIEVTGEMASFLDSYRASKPPRWNDHNHAGTEGQEVLIAETLAKEVMSRHKLIMHPCTRLLEPLTLISPIGVAMKKNGSLRITTDSSFRLSSTFTEDDEGNVIPSCLNEASPSEFLTTNIYGSSLWDLLSSIYRTRMAHPDLPIYMTCVDTVQAFPWTKLNPRAIPLVAIRIFGFLFYSVALAFGQSFSPSEHTVVGETATLVWKKFTGRVIKGIPEAWAFAADYALDEPVVEPHPVLQRAWEDGLNPPLVHSEDSPPVGRLFVDDGNMIGVQSFPNALSCLLTGYLFAQLCYWSPISYPQRQPFVNVAKMVQWARLLVVLGVLINTDALTFSAPAEKVQTVRHVIEDWLQETTRLSAKDLESLLGSIRFVSMFLPCGSFLVVRLQGFLNKLLRNSYRFDKHLKLQYLRPISGARQPTYKAPREVQDELIHLLFYLKNPAKYMTSPIEKILWRTPKYHLTSDASGWGAGGFCHELKWGWRLQWPQRVKDWFERSRNMCVLEAAAWTINFCIMSAYCRKSHDYVPCAFFTDNKAARSWCSLMKQPTKEGAAIGRFLCYSMTSSRVHSRAHHVEGLRNPLSDSLSRSPPPNLIANTIFVDPLWARHITLPLLQVPSLLESTITSMILSDSSPLPHEMEKLRTEIESAFSQRGW